ncbi:TVP38/TMEM64 family protein [Haloferax sp. YSSS75]|uniref:TVP38/TMEM64 family protein n=1 Tax=Haloferax sp. YSSS75 TaxID=3388564 RepID=UPI00398D0C7E
MAVRQHIPFLFNARELRVFIVGFGIWAPIVFIAVQAIQVIIAPIPGQAAAVVAGYLFGPIWGTVYSLVGVMIGSMVAFCLSKRYGRPAVERFLHEEIIESFDGMVERTGLLGLFIFVLIPGLPDDVVCFLAGLTPIRIGPFLVVLLAGRFPAYAIANLAGGQFADGKILESLILMSVFLAFSAISYYNRSKIQHFVRRI